MKTIKQNNLQAQLSAFITMPLSILFGIVATRLYGIEFWMERGNAWTILTMLLVLVTLLPHEFLHMAGWMLCSKKGINDFKIKIKFPLGASIQFFGNMEVSHFLVGSIFPFLFTSLIPMIIGVVSGNFYVLIYGMYNALGCGSDAVIVIKTIKYIGHTCYDPGVIGVVINE